VPESGQHQVKSPEEWQKDGRGARIWADSGQPHLIGSKRQISGSEIHSFLAGRCDEIWNGGALPSQRGNSEPPGTLY